MSCRPSVLPAFVRRLAPRRHASGPTRVSLENGPWTRIGSEGVLGAYGRLRVKIPSYESPVMVVATKRGPVAFADRCPHLGRTLSDADLHGSRIRCRGHGHEFALDSGTAVGTRTRVAFADRLVLLPIAIVDGDLFIAAPGRAEP